MVTVSIDVMTKHGHLFLFFKPIGKRRRFKAKSDHREVKRNKVWPLI